MKVISDSSLDGFKGIIRAQAVNAHGLAPALGDNRDVLIVSVAHDNVAEIF